MVALAATVLGACGSQASGITSADADGAIARLDSIQSSFDSGDCGLARAQSVAFSNDISALDPATSANLRTALQSSADRLQQLINTQCLTVPTGATTKTAKPKKPSSTDSTGKDGEPTPVVVPTPDTGGDNTGGGVQSPTPAPTQVAPPPVQTPTDSPGSGGLSPDQTGGTK